MKYLHITQQGSSLKKLSNMLIVEYGKKQLEKIHTEKLTDIYLYGNIHLTPSVIKYVLSNNINVIFLSMYGKYIGKLIGENHKNVELKIAQYDKFKDDEFKLKIAREIVYGKLYNYRILLSRLNRKIKISDVSSAIHQIRNLIIKLEKADNIDTMRGYEGKGSAVYFSVFNYFLNGKFLFVKRNKRPPLDPVNVMLSFGYTMLTNIFVSIIYSSGLDPMLGNLHTIEYGRNSLALDLMEEFRPVIVDSLVVNIISRNIIKEENFTFDTDNSLPCIFTDEGKKIFISNFEKKLDVRIKYLKDNLLIPLRKIIESQVMSYKNYILDENKEYKSVVIR